MRCENDISEAGENMKEGREREDDDEKTCAEQEAHDEARYKQRVRDLRVDAGHQCDDNTPREVSQRVLDWDSRVQSETVCE